MRLCRLQHLNVKEEVSHFLHTFHIGRFLCDFWCGMLSRGNLECTLLQLFDLALLGTWHGVVMCVWDHFGASVGDQDAALRYLDLRLGIFADPIYLGMCGPVPTNPQVVLVFRNAAMLIHGSGGTS